MIRAIIIDDLPQARLSLKMDLANYAPDIEVVAEAEGVVDGALKLRKFKADVVFLDIQMEDGSGFDLLDILTDLSLKVIFITASDAYAIRAFQYAAIDYLLKPVDPDKLKAALEKYKKSRGGETETYKLLNESIKKSQFPQKRLALHSQDKIQIVNIEDIVRCESKGNYTIFFMNNQVELVVTRSLGEYEELLKPHHFIRVHHSHLVNGACVKELVKSEGGHLILHDKSMVPVSARKRSEVIKLLDEL
jgi:two-component system, LytTR family, response regulator